MSEKKLTIDSILIDSKKIDCSPPIFEDAVDESSIRGGKGENFMDYSKEVALELLSKKVGELNEFLQGSVDGRWGDNVVDIAMDVINEQKFEILGLESVIKAMKSEVEYALGDNKTEEVKRAYLGNAIRYANEAVYID